jgi:hypothetical protein
MPKFISAKNFWLSISNGKLNIDFSGPPEIKNYKGGLAASGMIFMLSFMKIRQVVEIY